MTKRIIEARVEEIDLYELETSLDNVLSRIKEYIKLYGKDARLNKEEYGYSYDSGVYHRYYLTIKREETDEEYAKRTKEESERAASIAKRDAEEFERLKKKFGG